MNRRQFTQTTALALGSTLAARTLSVAKMDRRAIGLSNHGPGDWQMVPAALSRFDWHKVIARPRSSPGLTNWCNIDRHPESKQIIISFTEITDPAGTMREDPPRMDFSGLRRTQRFLVSEDRGESWQNLAEHPFENSPDSWQLNGGWERLKFLRNGKIVSFKSEHTQAGRRPMIFYSHSNDTATSWSNWRPMCDNPRRGMFGGDLCQLKDGRWIYFYELYDLNLPSFKCRIRRKPAVWMDRSVAPRRFGCAISEDDGHSWKDRPDLDISMEEEFNRGEPFEPAVVQLKNENLLAVVRLHRLAGFGGEGLPWRQ
ncbi:MAG: exo-alpha-sialidase [Acidobacteria bacterium]|nr:exo-alpha-sialidase [Acidobacteriota bacterium]